jgi:hypothetical protein
MMIEPSRIPKFAIPESNDDSLYYHRTGVDILILTFRRPTFFLHLARLLTCVNFLSYKWFGLKVPDPFVLDMRKRILKF